MFLATGTAGAAEKGGAADAEAGLAVCSLCDGGLALRADPV
jgi:hypothetical protein